MEDPIALTRRLGGIAHRQDLVRVCGRRAVDAAVADGRLLKPGRSWITLPDLADDVRAARTARGVLGGLSAALHHGWAVKAPPGAPEILVPATRGRLPAGHRRTKAAQERAKDGVLTPVATVIDCAVAHPFDVALCVADSALRSRRVTVDELARAALPLPPHLRRRVGRVLDAASPLAANPFESAARAIAIDVPGLNVVPQGDIDGIGHGDLVDARLRIVVECESHEFHSLPEAFRYDVRRYTRMVLADWIVIRVVWEDVMTKPELVRSTLVEAVALAERRLLSRPRA